MTDEINNENSHAQQGASKECNGISDDGRTTCNHFLCAVRGLMEGDFQ